jgi:uncharacterized protein
MIASLNLFKDICSKDGSLTINFTGGEPLLNMEILYSSVDFIRKNAALNNARLVIFTNGTLLSKDTVEFLRVNNFLIIVSLDGPSVNHN